MQQKVFTPDLLGTVSLSVTGSSNRVAIVPGRSEYTLYNSGSVVVFVDFGGASITTSVPSGATAGGYPIGPGVKETIGVQQTAGVAPTNIAAIGASAGPSVLYISSGAGF